MKKTLTIVSSLLIVVLSVIGIMAINSVSMNYTSNTDFNIKQTNYQNENIVSPIIDDYSITNTGANTSITYDNRFEGATYIDRNENNNADSYIVLLDNVQADEAYVQIPFEAADTDNLSVSFSIKLLNNEQYHRIWFTTEKISKLNGPAEINNICIETAFSDLSKNAYLTNYNYINNPNNQKTEYRQNKLQVNAWENVRYEINQKDKTFDVYVNDLLIASGLKYALKDNNTSNTGINNVVFGTGTNAANSICIDHVQVYNKDTETMLVNEEFNSFDNVDYSTGINCDVKLAVDSYEFDSNVFAFVDNSTDANSLLQYTFGKGYDYIDCSFDISFPYEQDGINVWFANEDNACIHNDETIAVSNLYNVGLGIWNSVQYIINLKTNTYDSYINDTLIENNAPFNESDINTVVIGSNSSSKNLFFVNNLSIKTTVDQYDVNVDSVNGNVEYSPVKDHYDVGDEITITPIANEGYSFESLYINDIDITNELIDGSYTLTVGEEDVTIKPVFAANKYTITYNVDENCEIEATSQEVTYNANYSLLVPTKDGYTFDGWFNGTEKVEDGIWNNTNNIELTAQWTFIVVEEPFEDNNVEENNDAVSGDSNTHQGANEEDLNDTVIQQPTEDSNLFDDKIANVNPSNNEDNSKEIIIIASAAAVGTSLLGLLLAFILKRKKRV